ncbi:hypothetical protein PybrP1_013031 [[Pythium] brassicae (nom. inval.)]|nr:hypothetical protein PybrP1_013031 [[Pythium] brassicae (nom. inval.)]
MPGSRGGSAVCCHCQLFGSLLIHLKGEHLLSDSAYAMTSTIVQSYKQPAANNPANVAFNVCGESARLQRALYRRLERTLLLTL